MDRGEFDYTLFSDETSTSWSPNKHIFQHCRAHCNFFSNEILIYAITKIQLLTEMIFWLVLTLKNVACNLRNKKGKTWIILQQI